MAVDSRDKRASAIGVTLPVPSVWPNPDGTVDAADRVQVTWLYADTLPGVPAVGAVGRALMRGMFRGMNRGQF